MARAKPPPGMKPLFGSSASASPSASAAPKATARVTPPVVAPVPVGDLVFIEPRPYCQWSSKTLRWKGHGSALVRDKFADPRLLAKDYAKNLKKTDHYADSDADLIPIKTLRGGPIEFTKRCVFPVVHLAENLRVDLTIAAYASKKGDQVVFIDTAFGGAPDVMFAGSPDPEWGVPTALVNKPKASDVTLMVACFNYDYPEMKADVVSNPNRARFLGTIKAMREAVGDEETRGKGFLPSIESANDYLQKELSKCECDAKFVLLKKKLLKAPQLDWPKIVKAAFESL